MSSRPYHQKDHVHISSTDEFSSAHAPSRGTNEAVQSIVGSRKCWKTIKGKGEVVWPPHLEAALVEGLERYRPVETRSARALGRFPMRNKFISDYIFQVTGKHRTPKQVGSRLQQLRDTCEGKRILKLLSHRPGSPRSPSAEHSTVSPEPSTSTAPQRDYLTVDVLPPDMHPSSAGASHAFRPLHTISNVVTFRSATTVDGESRCSVFKNGVCVFTVTTGITLQTSSCTPAAAGYNSDVACVFMYTAKLVPGFWMALCAATDIGAYSISQDIVARTPSQGLEAESSQATSERVLSSVVYQFNTPQTSPPSSPSSSNGDAYSYTTESSVDQHRELEHMLAMAPSQQAQYPRYPLHAASSFDMSPPALVRDEDGYGSLPQSPLDAVFPSGIALGAAAALASGADALLAKGYDVDYAGSFDATAGAPAYAHGMHAAQPGYSPF